MHVTPRGLGLTGGGAALVVAGISFGYPELTVIGCAALICVVCAAGYTSWRPRLTVTRVADPDRVSRGEASTMTVTVRNTSRLRGATPVAYDQCGDVDIRVPLPRLRPGHHTTVDYQVPTHRRGVVRIGPLRITRRDPLALVGLSRRYGQAATVWVYPRTYPISTLPTGVARSMDGLIDKVPHGSITFDALREYVVGDDLRHVHWRTSARIGELMVREHVDTSLPRLVVLLDNRRGSYQPTAAPTRTTSVTPSAAGGTPSATSDAPPTTRATSPTASVTPSAAGDADSFEAVCEAAASLTVAAIRDDLPIDLVPVHGDPVGGGGTRVRSGARPYLDLLAEITLNTDHTPDQQLDTVIRRLRQRRLGDTLIFLTGTANPDDIGRVASLRGSYPSIIVGVLGSTDDTALSTVAGVLVLNAQDGTDFAAVWDGVRAC